MKTVRFHATWYMTLALCMSLLFVGCVRGPRIDDKNLRKAANSFDKIDKYLERFGTASISSMLLVEDKGQFALDYNQPTSEYVSRARSGYQGAAQRFFQRATDVQQAQVSQIDADELAKSALLGGPEGKALIDAGLKVATGLGVTGAGPDTAAALIDREEVQQGAPAFESQLKPNAAAAVLNSPTFSDPLARIEPPSELSERRALLIAVNDKITENILKYLAHPEGVPGNKMLYIGILEVSVNPGWGTREGYMADIVVTPEYAKGEGSSTDKKEKDIRKEAIKPDSSFGTMNSLDGYYFQENWKDISGRQPVVLAAFPLLEAQTLDLRNSERTQDAFVSYIATLLQESGLSQQNETLSSMVKRLEYDSASRSPIPLVTSYSTGDSFGFQFMPAFQALADPSDSTRGSANVLHPYSFPAMVLLQCERKEISPKGLNLRQIRLNVSSRWLPMKDRRMDFPARYGSRARIGIANELDRAVDDLRKYDASGKKTPFAWEEAELRLRQIEPLATGVAIYSELPPYSEPPEPGDLTIAEVFPNKGLYNASTVLTITGTGFASGSKSLVKSVTIAGRNCEFVVAGKNTLVAIVPPWTTDVTKHNHGNTVIGKVVVATTRGAFESKSSVTFNKDDVLHFKEDEPAITVARDAAGRVTQVIVTGTSNASSKIIDSLNAIVEQESKSIGLDNVEFEIKIK